MVGSVSVQKKFSSNFFSSYDELCRQRKVKSFRSVKEHAWKKTIDFYADRIKCDDWIPIIDAISTDRTLHCVAIRSRYEKKGDIEEFDTREKACKAANRPAIQTKFVMNLLVKALYGCISGSALLTCLVLEGLSVKENYVSLLCTGVSKCCSLQNISFNRCCLGDYGCEMICNTIKHLPNIRSIGMSGCNIGDKGGYHLYLLIKHQQLERYNESWKQSLRYRVIDGSRLGGVRRITLNDNKDLGDVGIAHLIEILKDDFWLKAIDLQNCGLTDDGAFNILQMLEINTVLLVVDIRNNRHISSYVEQETMNMLFRNNMQNIDEAKEYGWMPVAKPIEKSSSSQGLTSSSSGSSLGSKSTKKLEISSQRVTTKSSISTIKRSGFYQRQYKTTEEILKELTAGNIGCGVRNNHKNLQAEVKRFQIGMNGCSREFQKRGTGIHGGHSFNTINSLGNSFKTLYRSLRVGDGDHTGL